MALSSAPPVQALSIDLRTRAARIAALPGPELRAPDEALLEVLEVGICGTDREIARGHYGSAPAGRSDLVLGHECLARVIEVGPAVEGLVAGDLVVPTVRRPCSEASCRPCRGGHQDACSTGRFVERGIRGADGFIVERAVEQSRHLAKIPPALVSVGVLVEPLTVAEKALAQLDGLLATLPWLAGSDQSTGALVVGAGPIGLLGAALLLMRGWPVTVCSRSVASAPKARLAVDLGARYLCTSDRSLPGSGPADGGYGVILEAAGAASATLEAMSALSLNGVLLLTGLASGSADGASLAAALTDLVLGNRVVVGSVNSNVEHFRAAADDLALMHARWPEAIEALITSRVALVDSPRALEAGDALKTVVTLGR